ncbi:MAG TPA: hypothetical protein VKG92_04225 [Flavobacteriales bacterium]|nr:hypothetical protein [Flavobacteriales bacterium]
MRCLLSASLLVLSVITASAQYGTFSAAAVKAAKPATLVVVLDAGDSPYNRTITNAVKGEWKFNPAYEFVTVAELGTQPLSPEKVYLLKTSKVDPVKFEGTFLTLVQGWKQKKGEVLQQKNNAFTTIPQERELAFILIDPLAINERHMDAMLMVYIKHLQDYLKLVEGGKIIDKATADRVYSGRTRLVRDTELVLATEHVDKSLPDVAKIKESYTSPCALVPASMLITAVQAQERTRTVSDVVITGDNKNKYCFKRLFNAGTGELMYLREDAAIFGKKEGFIDEDLNTVQRAR